MPGRRGGVQDSTVFGDIDFRVRKVSTNMLINGTRFSVGTQRLERLPINDVF